STPTWTRPGGKPSATTAPIRTTRCRPRDATTRDKNSSSGDFLERRGLARQRRRTVVPGVHSVEPSLLALHFHSYSSRGGAVHHWPFPDSRVHGRVRGARRVWLGHSR